MLKNRDAIMNIETNKHKIAKRWFKLLRDPKSEQAFGALRRLDGAQCCLGWLCQAAGLKPIKEDDGMCRYEDSYGVLPESVQEVMNMTQFALLKPAHSGVEHLSLAVLNDDKQLSLSEIADIAEEAYLNDGFVGFNED